MLKIYLFRDEFPFNAREEESIRDICIFIARIYVEAWFTAHSAPLAPNRDSTLKKSPRLRIDQQ